MEPCRYPNIRKEDEGLNARKQRNKSNRLQNKNKTKQKRKNVVFP